MATGGCIVSSTADGHGADPPATEPRLRRLVRRFRDLTPKHRGSGVPTCAVPGGVYQSQSAPGGSLREPHLWRGRRVGARLLGPGRPRQGQRQEEGQDKNVILVHTGSRNRSVRDGGVTLTRRHSLLAQRSQLRLNGGNPRGLFQFLYLAVASCIGAGLAVIRSDLDGVSISVIFVLDILSGDSASVPRRIRPSAGAGSRRACSVRKRRAQFISARWPYHLDIRANLRPGPLRG